MQHPAEVGEARQLERLYWEIRNDIRKLTCQTFFATLYNHKTLLRTTAKLTLAKRAIFRVTGSGVIISIGVKTRLSGRGGLSNSHRGVQHSQGQIVKIDHVIKFSLTTFMQ
jgi:hypothetical protein